MRQVAYPVRNKWASQFRWARTAKALPKRPIAVPNNDTCCSRDQQKHPIAMDLPRFYSRNRSCLGLPRPCGACTQVDIKSGIRHRLVTVVFLGVVTSALSLVALVRMLSTATSQRVERGRDYVEEETTRLATATGTTAADRGRLLAESPRSQIMGMWGGYADARGNLYRNVPDAWRRAVSDVVTTARDGHTAIIRESDLPDCILLAGARPAASGEIAWVAYPIRTPPYLNSWRWIVLALSLVTLLLAATAVQAVITFKRGAGAISKSLVGLAKDLSTPVPRPPMSELGKIADGIAVMARSLATAREAQERMARELEQQARLAALGRVVAGVAHEVRNPLASIKLRLDLAVSEAPTLPPIVEQAVGHASAEIARLDRLVADLLVVAGRSLGPRRRVDVGRLVRERTTALLPWAKLRRVEIAVEGEGTADVDADSMARAFDNLLRNAIEASPPDDTVHITITPGEALQIIIDDRGTGVDQERAAMLFEPFFTTKSNGTGLGLAISRAIARAHGGDATYERRGAVTRFTLSLPRPLATAPTAREASA